MSFKNLFVLVLCLLAFACGKKTEDKKDPKVRTATPVVDDFNSFLEKQSIICTDTSNCPSYIAKVVVRHGPGDFRTCTGFLTGTTTLATSASCLPEKLRLKNAECSADMAFYFYNPASKGQRVGCKNIIQASPNFESNPLLNREDLVFIRLDETLLFRRFLKVSREGFGAIKNITMIGVEKSDEYTGEIKELNCDSITDSYINPFVTDRRSPQFVMSRCAFVKGFTGAPVMDGENWNSVRGVVSVGADEKVRTFLLERGILTSGLNDFIHGTNLACAATIYSAGSTNSECLKDLTLEKAQTLQTAMLNSSDVFAGNNSRLQNTLEDNHRFVRFDLQSTLNQQVQITPKCFKNVNWMTNDSEQNVYNMKIPRRTFKYSMNENAVVESSEIDGGSLNTHMSWNPREIKRLKVGTLYYWGPNSNSVTKTFKNVPVCL